METTETTMTRYTKTPYSFVQFLFGVLQGLLIARFVFLFLGARAAHPFVRALYGVTNPFVNPFKGMFANATVGGFFFEWSTLIAMIAYAILAAIVMRLLSILTSTFEPFEEEEVHHTRRRVAHKHA